MKNTLKKKLWLSSRISRVLIEERQQRCWRQNDFDGFMQRCKILQLHVYSLLTTGVLKKNQDKQRDSPKVGTGLSAVATGNLSLQRMLDQAPFHWQKSFVFQDSRDLQLTTGRFFEKFLRPDFLWKFRSISSTWDEVMEPSIQLGIKMEDNLCSLNFNKKFGRSSRIGSYGSFPPQRLIGSWEQISTSIFSDPKKRGDLHDLHDLTKLSDRIPAY